MTHDIQTRRVNNIELIDCECQRGKYLAIVVNPLGLHVHAFPDLGTNIFHLTQPSTIYYFKSPLDCSEGYVSLIYIRPLHLKNLGRVQIYTGYQGGAIHDNLWAATTRHHHFEIYQW